MEAFALLEELLGQALDSVDEQPTAGGIQSDAIGLVFNKTTGAIRAGRALFTAAFEYSVETPESPLWLRGVVSPVEDGVALVTEQPYGGADEGDLTVRHFSDDLLRAVNVEQSGTKGVRLLVDNELLDQPLIDEFAIKVGQHRHLIPLRSLRSSQYPDGKGVSGGGYADLLWMIPDPITSWKEWETQEWRLSKALRAAGRQPEEFTQLAATSLVFHEAGAILGSVALRRTGGLPGAPGN